MTETEPLHRSIIQSIKKNILLGVLVLVPIWVTLKLAGIFLSFLHRQVAPILEELIQGVGSGNTILHQLMAASWVQVSVAVLLLLIFFYCIGWIASRWIGRQFILLVDKIMERIPVAKSIYGAVKGMTSAMQHNPEAGKKVVLIDFPGNNMKTIGLVTKITKDCKTGEELAVVFIPDSPAPTSGFLEIIPVSRLVITDWSVESAMSFLMSGGTDIPANFSLVSSNQQEDI